MRPRRRITPYLLVAPALALFTFAVLGPIVVTGVFSFFEWDGFGPFDPVGFANYVRAAADPLFLASFVHVAIYITLTIFLEVFVGLVLAGLVTARPRGTGLFRVAFFIPVMLPMVVVAVLWDFVYNPDFGLLNSALIAVGLEEYTQVWLGDTRFALTAVSVVSGWVFAGFYMAIFYAGFRGIPLDVLEAARIDGAVRDPDLLAGEGADDPSCHRGGAAPVHHRWVPGLRSVLRVDQRRAVQLDRDPHDLSGPGGVP